MKKFKLLRVILNLFEGGAAAGAAGTAAGASAAPGDTNGKPASTQQVSGETAKVVYGKQDAASEGTAAENTPAAEEKKAEKAPTREERRKAYYDLINGDYKEFYTEDTQRMINRRFKETKTAEDELGKYKPIISQMCQRYKVEDGNLEKLQAAMDADTTYLEEDAEALGMTPDGYAKYLKMQRENDALQKAQAQRQNQELAQQTYNGWMDEAKQMAESGKYPGFDLNAEAQNPNFVRLLQSGIKVEDAYKVIHMDEIVADSARSAAQTRERQVTESIRTQGRRPTEAGASSQAAFVVKDDVSKLTREDRANIVRQVAAGKRIEF